MKLFLLSVRIEATIGMKWILFGAPPFAKAPKESSRREGSEWGRVEVEGQVSSYRGHSYIKRKLLKSRLRICKAFLCAPKIFRLFGQKAFFRNTAPRNTK